MQSERKRMLRGRWVCAGLALSMLLLLPGLASAQDAKRYRDQIAQFNQRVVELRKADASGSMSKELDQSAKWLEDALVQLGKEEMGAVKSLLRRAEVQIDYVDSTLTWKRAKADAESTLSDLKEAESRLSALKDEIKALEDKEASLTK